VLRIAPISKITDCVQCGGINMTFKTNTFEINMRDNEKFTLACSSQTTKDQWLAAISVAVARATSAHFLEPEPAEERAQE